MGFACAINRYWKLIVERFREFKILVSVGCESGLEEVDPASGADEKLQNFGQRHRHLA